MEQSSEPGRSSITVKTFGRYRLLGRLAWGGMAEILLARDLGSDELVVVKRILPQFASNREFVQLFIHEGRLGQRLKHPNLVRTLGSGQVHGSYYIALEYLRGGTAMALLRAATRRAMFLPLGLAVRVVADAARGLDCAHRATDHLGRPLHVVHRDVTPHNVLCCMDGPVKVLDFGIAKAASQLHRTRTGTIKGKLAYLAPEQVRSDTIDHRVDVFALGIVLYELLTMRPLFRGANDGETLDRVLNQEIVAPERIRRDVPPGLGAIALRALQRDRDRRLPTAAALADSLEAVAEMECIDATPEVVAAQVADLCPPRMLFDAPGREPDTTPRAPRPPSPSPSPSPSMEIDIDIDMAELGAPREPASRGDSGTSPLINLVPGPFDSTDLRTAHS